MNIFEIQKDLLSIFDEIEENGGELTEELEQNLAITQDSFKSKVESYTNVIKSLKGDIEQIKNEQKRLKELADTKSKVIEKLSNIIIYAINEFGDTSKADAKYIDYGTGKVSIRKSTAVDVDTELVENVEKALQDIITYGKETNQLGTVNHISNTSIKDQLSHITEQNITDDELDKLDLTVEIKMPLIDVSKGLSYDILRNIAARYDDYKLKTSLSKTKVKLILEENGAALPNLAKLGNNESLTIK